MKWVVFLFCFLATAASAQSVSVKSGEHGDFTRLVLTFPNAADWDLGRTEDGYELKVGIQQAVFNLSSVYDLIDRKRLRSIWVDPGTGHLQLGIGCACHIIPFELGAQTLVLDIRGGPPPEQSSFENAFSDGTILPPLAGISPDRPKARISTAGVYNWIDSIPTAAGTETTAEPTDPTATRLETESRLDTFRTMVVDELGRGATAGIIDMDVTAPLSTDPPSQAPQTPSQARAALDELPGITVAAPNNPRPDLATTGADCPDPQAFDLSEWSDTNDAGVALSEARGRLLTEFDVPNKDNVIAAAKTHLYFGFGAEARGMIHAFLPSGADTSQLVTLSYILDGETPSFNAFADLQSCGSPAAMWSLLAETALSAQDGTDGDAVAQAFLGLPKHLRLSLGPTLLDRLQAIGDMANAEVVKQAFARSAAPETPTLALVEAEQALLEGNPDAAEKALPGSDRSDDALKQLFALVEARFQKGKPLAAGDLLALEAFAFEQGSGPLNPEFDRALSHAYALNGDFQKAFARAAASQTLTADVWSLLAKGGSTATVLEFGVSVPKALQKGLEPETRLAMATRLMDAGLPNAASDWLDDQSNDSGLSARVAIANNDARGALRLLSATASEADPALLASAYQALGAYEEASAIFEAADMPDQARQLQFWQNKWPASEDTTGDAWAVTAQLLAPSPADSALPPLQSGQALLETSVQTRDAVAALLAEVTVPEP